MNGIITVRTNLLRRAALSLWLLIPCACSFESTKNTTQDTPPVNSAPSPAIIDPTPQPTILFETPEPLAVISTDDWPVNPKPRLVHWNGDHALDILVAKGGGVWVYLNAAKATTIEFEEPQQVMAEGSPIESKSNAAVVLIDVIGDPQLDLILTEDKKITIYVGIKTEAGTHHFSGSSVSYDLPSAFASWMDAGDINDDGLVDIIRWTVTGTVDAILNTGTASQPDFSSSPLAITEPLFYNLNPRLFDFNQDQKLDLSLGYNWGFVEIRTFASTQTASVNYTRDLLLTIDGQPLNSHTLTVDNAIQEFGDLDQDGILDILLTGQNHTLSWARGSDPKNLFDRIDLPDNARGLHALIASETIRAQTVRTLNTALLLAKSSIAHNAIKDEVRAWLKKYELADDFKKYNPDSETLLAWIVETLSTTVAVSADDTHDERISVAETLQLPALHRKIWTDFGLLVLDNFSASNQQLELMYTFLSNIPRQLWHVQITIIDSLGGGETYSALRGSTIRISDTALGISEDSFPSDAPYRDSADRFLLIFAHEINHTALDDAYRQTWSPSENERQNEILARAAMPYHIVFHRPYSRGVDLVATKLAWKQNNIWDGNDANWDSAWDAYFDRNGTGGGKLSWKTHLRGSIAFFLRSPQESFATLANQYFDNTLLMLETAVKRTKEGYPGNLDQFFLIMEYYANGEPSVTFHDFDKGGIYHKQTAELTYDANGYVHTIAVSGRIFTFNRDEHGWTQGASVTCN